MPMRSIVWATCRRPCGFCMTEARHGQPGARPCRGSRLSLSRKAPTFVSLGTVCRRKSGSCRCARCATSELSQTALARPRHRLAAGTPRCRPWRSGRASGGRTFAAQIQDPGVGARRVRPARRARARPPARPAGDRDARRRPPGNESRAWRPSAGAFPLSRRCRGRFCRC